MGDFVFTLKDIDLNQVYVLGRSLGGAVAIYVTSSRHYDIAGLIVENSFTNIPDMVDSIFPYLASIKNLVLRNFWPNDQRISKIHNPIFFIKAEKDEIVPPEQMDKLHKLSTSQSKQLWTIPNATHNGSWMLNPTLYFTKLNQFMQK